MGINGRSWVWGTYTSQTPLRIGHIFCAWGLPELMRGILGFFFIAKICITNTKMFGGLVLSSGKDFNHNESPELLQWVHDHGQGVSRVSVMEPQIFWFRNLCKSPS